jgi:predicted ATP-dependent serine protease
MAISILVSLKELKPIIPEHTSFIGSLPLYGRVQPVEGMFPAVLASKKLGLKKMYIPLMKGCLLWNLQIWRLYMYLPWKRLSSILMGKE